MRMGQKIQEPQAGANFHIVAERVEFKNTSKITL